MSFPSDIRYYTAEHEKQVLAEVAILVGYIINQAHANPHDSLMDIANEALEVSPFYLCVIDDTESDCEDHPYRVVKGPAQ